MISALILTYQEEANLPRCLDALTWCDDVLIVDSFSTDRTVEIAHAYGARVLQRHFDDFAGQRNYGLACGDLRHEWVLHLDADEVVTSELVREMRATLPSTHFDAFRLASKTIFFDQWLKYAGMYPSYQVRVGRRQVLHFQQVGHGQRESLPAAQVGTLQSPLLHYSFTKGLADWFEKHNRYSTAEAARAITLRGRRSHRLRGALTDPTERRRFLKDASTGLPFRPTLRFLYMYVWRRGFLDGAAGYIYCRLLAQYEYMIVVKIREASWGRRRGGNHA